MYKFLLLFLLFAGNAQTENLISQPVTSEINTKEDVLPGEKTFESNPLQRGITAWLGLPEKQLTLRNAGLNSISHIVNRIEIEYRARFYQRGGLLDKRGLEILVITLTLVAINLYIKYNSPLYGETLSKISVTRIIQDLLNSPTIQRLLIDICNRNNLLKKEANARVLLFINLLLYFKRLGQRVDIVKKIKDKNFAIESRMIPEEFKGKEYFVLNSLINNLSLNFYSIYFNNEFLKSYVNICLLARANFPYKTIADTITEVPATIPWTNRLYILKSDAEKHLSTDDYETLKDLVQMDYRSAMEKIIHFSNGRNLLISQAIKNHWLPYIS